jgi:hypothetical protein
MAAVAPEVARAIESGPIAPADALALGDLERLCDPEPVAAETGWCRHEDATQYVAVRTEMPGVSGEMVDWWFDWHPRDPERYRLWHPLAHRDNRLEPAPAGRAKAHWGAVHHPVEDVGTGVAHARISFCAPGELGFGGDHLDDPAVATIVCGHAGDDRARMRHSPMAHVFLREGDGVVLRSRFWLGAAIRPYAPAPLAAAGAWAFNRPVLRRRALPRDLAPALARHCAEEYANLGALLPGLYAEHAASADAGR